MFCWRLMACTLLAIASPCWAQDPRPAIQGRYARAAQGARYKFVDGLLANRAGDFQLFSRSQERMDLSLDRTSFKLLFESALQVRLVTKMERLSVTDSRHVRCWVDQSMEVDRPNPRTRQVDTTCLKVRLIDDWERSDQGWFQKRTQILSQEFTFKS